MYELDMRKEKVNMMLTLEKPLRDALEVCDKLQRETDDATARPVFVVFRVSSMIPDHSNQAHRSDFSPMDIAGVFWTREEADIYCKRNQHNDHYFSWGAPAHGVLAEIMDYTCKREIERKRKREESQSEKR